MPLAYDVHPEFGYFCPGPRFRRELRVALVSILFGMVIGAVIVNLRASHAAPSEPDIVPASVGLASPENTAGLESPAASLQAPSFAGTAAPAVSGTKKRRSATHARHHRDDENENARRQNRRVPYGAERGYAGDQYWRSAYRHWVYW